MAKSFCPSLFHFRDIKQSQVVTATAQNSDAENVTSNVVSTSEQDMVSREKMVELTNHYDGKIKMMSEESDKLRGQLADKELEVQEIRESAADKENSIKSLANGVRECCEYIEVHATNGAITNGLLLWADIQRKQQPLDMWKAEAEKRFLKEEITEAKESLWRTAGEQILGKLVNRKGASKISSEMNDICDALKTLSENDKIPMFICTSSMVARTPIYQSDPDNTQDTKRFDAIDQSLRTVINMIHSNTEKADTVQRSNEATANRAGETLRLETQFRWLI